MSRYGGIDQYALHKYGRILAADTVHHIVPAEEEPGLFWSPDNLIPVSRSSHDEIHTTYRAPNHLYKMNLSHLFMNFQIFESSDSALSD